ncbi:MAG: MFS transporter [Bacteroidota bacterium]
MNPMSARLSLMMFLQFFVWGAWYVTVGNYMTAIGWGEYVYLPYLVNPIAAIVSPFFLGLIADRYFSTEKVLGVLHILGGLAFLAAPLVAGGEGTSVTLFIALILVHELCYMPTLGLTNSLAFSHIDDQEKQFPLIRVFGTVGWIVAGLFVSFGLGADATPIPLYVAGGAGVLMGLYSFSLPHTPPQAAGQQATFREIAGVGALKQLWSRPFAVFIFCSLLICIPLAAYYSYAPVFVAESGVANPAGWMTIGQMSEVLFMLVMPLFFARLGVKWMLLVGMGAWVLRYGVFAAAAPTGAFPLILVGIALHGICYDFFFVTGQIYVDKKSTPAIRGQAQGLLVLVTYGVGMLIGGFIAGMVYNGFLGETAEALTPDQFQTFWTIPALFAGLILLLFGFLFKDDTPKTEAAPALDSPDLVAGAAT